jgi:hypothetical protein
MTSALFYLQFQSAKNRLLSRFRRLKQPKYLFGAIVGGAYFYFFRYLFSGMYRGSGRMPIMGPMSPETRLLLESLAALILLVIVVLAWIVPNERAALTFTEAEVAFLFPAPINRRGLIHFKLIRSQVRIFFTIFFLTIVFNRFSGARWIHAAGWWLVLSTLNLHFLGTSFARTLLLDRGISNWRRRLVILTGLAVFVVFVVVWANHAVPRPDFSEGDGFKALKDYADAVLAAGPIPYLLYPFRLITRPYFAPDLSAFLAALGPAVLLLALHYVWVVRSNVAFEEASIEASRKLADKLAAMRAGNWRGAQQVVKKKRPPFQLRPSGFPAVAIFWKNLISAGQMFSPRLFVMLTIVAVAFFVSSAGISHGSGLMSAVGIMCAMFLGWSVLIGPQLMRQDLRHDLTRADVLKSFPLPGWQLVLGELLAPAAILTGVQWLLLIFASNVMGKIPHLTFGLSVAIVFSVAILLPLLDLVLLLIPNAGVLLFPAWFQTGKDGPQGIEATGQRLILMLGQLIAFALALIPAGIIFSLFFFGLKFVASPAVAVVPASLAAAVVLALEVLLGVKVLGRVFERFDLSAELNP